MTDIRDTSDPKQIEKSIKSSKQQEDLRKEGLRQLMSSEPGRAWLKGLLESCDPYRSPFTPDPIRMAFNCGESNIGLQLIAECHACSPELYLQMMKENPNG